MNGGNLPPPSMLAVANLRRTSGGIVGLGGWACPPSLGPLLKGARIYYVVTGFLGCRKDAYGGIVTWQRTGPNIR